MLPHQLRVVEEKAELDGKITKLNAFLETKIFAEQTSAEQSRLKRQLGHMQAYSDVLGDRICAFGS